MFILKISTQTFSSLEIADLLKKMENNGYYDDDDKKIVKLYVSEFLHVELKVSMKSFGVCIA